ncbi:hypothetical protein EWH71_04530, partial [Enterococcus faecium]
NLSQNVVHSDSDLILHNSSVLIDKEPLMTCHSHLSLMIFQTKKPSPSCLKQKDESLNFRVTTLIYRYFAITASSSTWT